MNAWTRAKQMLNMVHLIAFGKTSVKTQNQLTNKKIKNK